MPSLENVRTVVEDEQALDLDSGLERGGDNSDLPSQNAEPADCVAKDLLVLG